MSPLSGSSNQTFDRSFQGSYSIDTKTPNWCNIKTNSGARCVGSAMRYLFLDRERRDRLRPSGFLETTFVLLVRALIGEPLTLEAFKSLFSPLTVCYLPIVVPEIKLT